MREGVIEQVRRVLVGISSLLGERGKNLQQIHQHSLLLARKRGSEVTMPRLYVLGFSCVVKIGVFLILQVRKLRFHMAEFLSGSHTNLNR